MIFSVGKASVIAVFVGNCTVINSLVTAIADIRSFVQSVAALFYEIFAGLITGRAGSAFNTTGNDFVAGIRFFTVIAMNAKVVGIKEGTLVVPVT